MAIASPVTGTFTGTGQSDELPVARRPGKVGRINVTLTDGGSASGTVILEREFKNDLAVDPFDLGPEAAAFFTCKYFVGH